MKTKICSTCHIKKPINCFYKKHKNKLNSYQSKCKDCTKKYSLTDYYENKNAFLLRQKKWVENTKIARRNYWLLRSKKDQEELSNSYVRSLIINYCKKTIPIPINLISTYRELIRLNRKIKQLEKG